MCASVLLDKLNSESGSNEEFSLGAGDSSNKVTVGIAVTVEIAVTVVTVVTVYSFSHDCIALDEMNTNDSTLTIKAVLQVSVWGC